MSEVLVLDLDWDLIQHLGDPESVRALQAEQVNDHVIEDPLAREVFEWQFTHLREHGQVATASVIEEQFPDVTFDPEPQTAIGDLITRLRERYMRNNGRDIIKSLGHLANENPLAVGKEMVRVGRQLTDITTKRGDKYTELDFGRALQYYAEMELRGRGPTLGFAELDTHFNGILGVTFLLAPPKTYKSWFSTNTLMMNALTPGAKPYFYALELPAVDQEWRLACMLANLPYWKYLKNKFSPGEKEAAQEQMDNLREEGRFVIEKPAPGDRGVHHLIERAINAEATCVIIDQLQYMENSKGTSLGAANNTGDYWEVCNQLRDYSDEIPIFVVHQFNRSVMSAKEMPEMQQAKGSSAIEEVGTLNLALWGNKEMRKNNIVQVGTLASRHFAYNAWEIGVQLSQGCNLELLGEVPEEDE